MNELAVRSMDEVERAAKAMTASGFFADTKQISQAIVKILAGQELGFGAFASMTGVNIIQNKPVLAANLMAAAVKKTGKYNYRVIRLDDTGCELEFYEAGKPVGKSLFDKTDAEKAGLTNKDNWKKYPRNMYFARALSNGQKWYAPDVFNGATVYTPDELGAVVDDDGNAVIEVIPNTVQPIEPSFDDTFQLAPTAGMSLETANAIKSSDGKLYGDIDSEKLAHMLNALNKKADKTDEHLMKMDGIRIILKSRSGNAA
jgi:hypothetical protein